ncbi:MAG: hypothetical protein K0R47_5399 [Brevibacillus sp.]|nr:hypothetical protein [Brevibacillus sp.]
MKKRMAMAVMVLAVSAMAGSAFAADEPSKNNTTAAPQNAIKTQVSIKPAISLEQMAKEKGMTVEELIAQLKKEGKIKADKAVEALKVQPINGSKPLEGIQPLTAATLNIMDDQQGTAMLEVIDLEQEAKEKGITVEELIAQLEKEGKITKAATLTPATPIQK